MPTYLNSSPGRSLTILSILIALLPVAASSNDMVDEEVVVEDHREIETDTPRPDSVLKGRRLRARIDSTLGDTLEGELGVRSASFGPGVGIPVVRGLTGARVKMLQNGLGSHDASSISPDHAVTVEPLLAEEIRVVRGSNVIREGGGAIGGDVEVIDRRIPETLPTRAISGAVEGRHGRNPRGHAEVFKLDLGAGFLAAHVDGFLRESGLVDIPGSALDEPRVREQFGEAAQFESSDGVLINSDTEARGGSVGASLIGDRGFAGMAISTLSNNYGIPPGGLPPHSDIPGQLGAPQRIRVDIEQGRKDFKGALHFSDSAIEQLNLHMGLVNYRHHEIDGNRISTTFRNDALEGRSELALRLINNAPTTFGAQWIGRDFSALGFETFVPQSDIGTLGFYVTQRLEFARVRFEIAGRRETSDLEPQQRTQSIGGILSVRLPARLDYAAHSGAFEVEMDVTDSVLARASYSYAERPPEVQELLSLGPHLATRSFDVGNTELQIESGHIVDGSVIWYAPWWVLELDVYRRQMNNFIYQENLGFFFDLEEQLLRVECVRVDQCVSVFGYQQQDAVFNGFEGRLTFPIPLSSTAVESFEFAVFTDYVRGHFVAEGAGAIPRLPPRAYGASLALETARWRSGMRLTHTDAQRRAGRNETSSDEALSLSADLGYHFAYAEDREIHAFLRGHNLLDAEVRNATSFLRNFMPEPGRSVEIGLRVEF